MKRLIDLGALAALLLFMSPSAHGHADRGDVLQLFGFEADLVPAPIDGDISPDGGETKWRSAYVRSVTFASTDGSVTRDGTVFVTNDDLFLYLAIGLNSGSASGNNYATIYFDVDHDHALTGSPSAPGEYYVKLAGADPGVAENGGYYGGNGWQSYGAVFPFGFEAVSKKHGTGNPQTFNFEFQIPLSSPVGPSGESFLDILEDDEIGLLIEVFDQSDGVMYWEPTTRDPLDASVWGEAQLGVRGPERELASSVTLGHAPTIDGDVSSDPEWQHYTTIARTVLLTNYAGDSIDGTIYSKSDASDVYLGLVIERPAASGDRLNVFLDYDATTGGDVDYILEHLTEDGAGLVHTGFSTGTFEDLHFENSPVWALDGTVDGEGAASHTGGNYEFEMRIPLGGTGTEDLQVVLGALLGMNLEFVDASSGLSYWWDIATNSQYQQVRVDALNYTSLGWMLLQTGAPVVQPVYPRDGDEVSGHYPFMIYATAASGELGIVSAEFSDDLGVSWKALERTDESGIWTKTWDTTLLPDGPREIRIRVLDESDLRGTLVLDVVIDNESGGAGDRPVVTVDFPLAGEWVNGITDIGYTVTPAAGQAILSHQVSIDGGPWVDATNPYPWDTTPGADGSHIFMVRAVQTDSLIGFSDPRLVLVDNTPPEVEALTVEYPPGQTSAKEGDAVLVTALVRDDGVGLLPFSVSLDGIELDGALHTMLDDGANGDVVANDGLYSAAVTVTNIATGPVAIIVQSTDFLDNMSAPVQTTVDLDNTPPTLDIAILPAPSTGPLTGEVYQPVITLTGSFSDLPTGASVVSILLEHRNPDGHDVNDSPISIPPSGSTFSRVLRLLDGTNHFIATARDEAGLTTSVSAVVDYVVPEETVQVGPEGGTVQSPDGTMVDIPAGALLSTQNISIVRIPESELPSPVDPDLTLLKRAHHFGPDGLVFHKPVHITLTYTDADLDRDQNGMPDWDEQSLEAYFWEGADWVKTNSPDRRPATNSLIVKVNHFSVFDIGVTSRAAAGTQLYWTRNPFRPADGSTCVFELPEDGIASLKIYDLAGQRVATVANQERVSATSSLVWNGRNDFDRFVGSGVYVYLFEFQGDNGADVTIRKPLGVVK